MRIACPACRRLLLYVAEISEQAGPTDAVARLGGDEFAIALAGLQGPASADLVARKVVGLAGQEFQLAGRSVTIGASVGIAFDADAQGGWIQRKLLKA